MIYHGLLKNEVIELQKKYGKNILPPLKTVFLDH